jgi:hypothetical protein
MIKLNIFILQVYNFWKSWESFGHSEEDSSVNQPCYFSTSSCNFTLSSLSGNLCFIFIIFSSSLWSPTSSEVKKEVIVFFFNFYFLLGLGFELRALCSQSQHWLSHTSSSFCSGYFGDEMLWTIYQDWPWTIVLSIWDPPSSQDYRHC